MLSPILKNGIYFTHCIYVLLSFQATITTSKHVFAFTKATFVATIVDTEVMSLVIFLDVQ